MKKILTTVFWPILVLFETDEKPVNYKKSHRVALNVLGALFIFLSLVSTWAAYAVDGVGSLISVIVFFSVGLTALVIGTLGSKGAVAKIWGSK
jgi:hypothetical protein